MNKIASTRGRSKNSWIIFALLRILVFIRRNISAKWPWNLAATQFAPVTVPTAGQDYHLKNCSGCLVLWVNHKWISKKQKHFRLLLKDPDFDKKYTFWLYSNWYFWSKLSSHFSFDMFEDWLLLQQIKVAALILLYIERLQMFIQRAIQYFKGVKFKGQPFRIMTHHVRVSLTTDALSNCFATRVVCL